MTPLARRRGGRVDGGGFRRRAIGVPRIPRTLVLWLVDGPSAEFIVGDLDEAYRMEVAEGRRGARWRYWCLALASIGSRWSGRRQHGGGRRGTPAPRRPGGVTNDVRFALRLLRKNPAFTTMVVLTLAMGIAANTAVFSVLNGVLLRPLPYDDPHEVINVWQVYYEWQDSEVEVFRNLANRFNVSYPVFLAWQERGHVFEGVAAYSDLNVVVEGPDIAEWLPITESSAGLFDVLGVEPHIGRGFRPEEDVAGGERVVVLSYAFWMERFAGDPSALGRELRLTGVPYTIIGVMPAGFYFPQREQQLWIPLRDSQRYDRWTRQSLEVVARLRDGISLQDAQREMDAITLQILADNPESPEVGVRLVGRIEEVAGRQTSNTLSLVMAAVGLVLLVTVANLAGLLLVRTAERHQEIAVRRALGASGRRLVTQSMIEGFIVVLAGGALAFVATASGMGWIKSQLPVTIPRAEDIAIDWRVLGFTAAVSVAIAFLFGLVSAVAGRRYAVADVLRTAGPGSSAARQRGKSLLVVCEMAIAVVLLAGAVMLLHSYRNLAAVDRGFDERSVLTLDVGAPLADWSDERRLRDFFRRATERIEQIPGVRSVATVSTVPFAGGQSSSSFGLTDNSDGESEAWSLEQTVGTAYFETLAVSLLRGRLFDDGDRADSEKVAIINQRLADYYWPDADPIGELIWEEGVPFTIIGIVANNKHNSLTENVERMRYYVDAQDPEVLTSLVVRTDVPPTAIVRVLREAVHEVAASATISNVASLESLVARTTALPRFRSLMLTGLAAIAVVLAVLGLYGVVALSVASRRREIGVRMTLGAQRGDILRQMVGRGARLMVAGVAFGLVAAVAAVRLIESYLFRVAPTSPYTLAAVGLVVLAIGGLATWMPARRATRIEPVIVLRGE